MPDREKVINDLRSIKTYFASQAIETTDDFVKLAFYESQKDIDDAIALLKEQERTGSWKDNGNGTISCSECGTWFQKEREPYLCFCGWCGAKMGRSVK